MDSQKGLIVLVCGDCKRMKRFNEFVTIPQEIAYAINSQELDTRTIQCPACWEHANK